jgi:hypothetical protein
MIRSVHDFNYARGVAMDESENWHLNEHIPQAKKLPGI